MQNTGRRFHYGWIIVGAGLILLAAAVGLVSNSFSLFIVPICNDLGFSRQAMAMNQTLCSLSAIPIALLSGKIFVRYRLGRLMKLSSVVLCAAYLMYSFSRNIAMFYAVSIAVAVAQSLLTWMPFSIIINNWFHDKRGLAMGLTFMGSGLGGMIFSMLTGQLLEYFTWQQTFQILSAILACIVIPTMFFIIKVHPYDVGMSPYGKAEGDRSDSGGANAEGLSFSEALRSPRFYALGISICFVGMAFYSGIATTAPHLADLGYSAAFGAGIVALTMGALSGGKLLLGILFDKLGTRRATYASLLATLCSLVGMYFAAHLAAMPAIILGIGLGAAFGTVAIPLLTRSVFGTKSYGALTGIFMACSNLGCSVSPTLLGGIYDATGSYLPGYAALFVSGTIAALVLAACVPSGRAQSKKYFRKNSDKTV